VKSGESLSEIADGYGLSMGKLVALNQISDPDNLQVGQRLRLQGTPPATTPQARATTRTTTTPVATAQPSVAPTPRQAAPAPRPVISTPRPQTTTAAVTTPAKSTPAASSTAAAGLARPDWRTYGPLQVDWANWLPMGGSLVTPTLNSEGQSLYLAINCTARKLNATSQAGQWKTWDDPQAEFEKQLVSDLCKSRS
jgi:LysM repeat protein